MTEQIKIRITGHILRASQWMLTHLWSTPTRIYCCPVHPLMIEKVDRMFCEVADVMASLSGGSTPTIIKTDLPAVVKP